MLTNERERERERVITWTSYQARSHSGIWPSFQGKIKTKQTKEIITIILFPHKDNDLESFDY